MFNKNSFVLSALLGYFVRAAEESVDTSTPANDRPTGGLKVDDAEFNMRYLPETDEIEFIVTMMSNSWFGLALGNKDMTKDGDMITFHRQNYDYDYFFQDRYSVGYQPPAVDEINNLANHPVRSIEFDADGRATLFARRALDTGDSSDFVIPLDQEFNVGYAVNGSSSDISIYTKHQTAGSVAVSLKSNGDPVWGELVVADPVDNVS